MTHKKEDSKKRMEEAIKLAIDDFRYEDLVHYMGLSRKEVNDLLDTAEITVKVNWSNRA